MLALEGLSGSTGTTGRTTGFWREADQIYSARLDAIRQAEKNIHFETFFMTSGRRADEFAEALIERAQAGVEVLMVVDAYGVGSSLIRGENDFTADIVMTDGRDSSKVGRRFRPNPRLALVG